MTRQPRTLAALLGLLLALLLFAPARWLGMALDTASGGRVGLLNPRGTVWTGQATLRLSGGAGSRDGLVDLGGAAPRTIDLQAEMGFSSEEGRCSGEGCGAGLNRQVMALLGPGAPGGDQGL